MHSWRVWVLAHAELGVAVFHCLFSLVPPVVIFHLTSRPQYSRLFANVLSRCIFLRKGCILRTKRRRRTRCPKNSKSPRSPPRGKLSPCESAMLSLLAWSVPSNSCPRKRATVFRLRRLPSSRSEERRVGKEGRAR